MKWPRRSIEEGTFASERHVTTTKRRRLILSLLAAAAVTGWLYVLFGSEIFRVSLVDAGELNSLERGEVVKETFEALDESARWPWSRRNLLLINQQELEQALERRLFADQVAVEKSYPNVLRLKIKERQSSLVLVANNEFYLVDRKGAVSKRMTAEEETAILKRISKPSPSAQTQVPILTIRELPPALTGELVVDETTVQRWLGAFQELSREGFGYRNAILEHATSTKLILNMYEPYDVHFDLLTSMQPQIQSYYAFTKTRAPSVKIYSYIDARIPGRIYYK